MISDTILQVGAPNKKNYDLEYHFMFSQPLLLDQPFKDRDIIFFLCCSHFLVEDLYSKRKLKGAKSYLPNSPAGLF